MNDLTKKKTMETQHDECKLSTRTYIGSKCIYAICWLIGLLPFWFLYYVLANIIYFVIYRIVRYRIGVVRSNLKSSFPEKSAEELKAIERKYYGYLSEIFVDTIDITSISRRQAKKRLIIENEERHRAEVRDKSWIAALGHYGSWEMFGFYAINDNTHDSQSVGVYRPLHNKAMDEFYKKVRSRFGMKTVSMKVILKFLARNRAENGVPLALGMIADQTPRSFGFNHWIDFLNHPTGFYRGIDQIATRLGMPVYFVHIERVSKSHYKARFELIYDGVEKVEEDEVTVRYAAKLEQMIKERPEFWMWSHKRWKHTPDSVEKERLERETLIKNDTE